jgi:hypothetical protein
MRARSKSRSSIKAGIGKTLCHIHEVQLDVHEVQLAVVAASCDASAPLASRRPKRRPAKLMSRVSAGQSSAARFEKSELVVARDQRTEIREAQHDVERRQKADRAHREDQEQIRLRVRGSRIMLLTGVD